MDTTGSNEELDLDPEGVIRESAANAGLLEAIAASEPLTNAELREAALRNLDTTPFARLGLELAAAAAMPILDSDTVDRVVESINDEEIGFSIFGDAWNFFKGGAKKIGKLFGLDDGCDYKCVAVAFGLGVYVKRCHPDDGWKYAGLGFCVGGVPV